MTRAVNMNLVVSELGHRLLLETAVVAVDGTTTHPSPSIGPFLVLAPAPSHSAFPELGRKGNGIFFETGTSLAQLCGLNTDPRALVQKCPVVCRKPVPRLNNVEAKTGNLYLIIHLS